MLRNDRNVKPEMDSGGTDEPADATKTNYAKTKLFAKISVTGKSGKKSENFVCALCEDNKKTFTEKPIACQVLISVKQIRPRQIFVEGIDFVEFFRRDAPKKVYCGEVGAAGGC